MHSRLTTTSYCLLGLIRLRSWSAYDLTKYMQRSALSQLWPRTEAAIYREAKLLAEHGFASVSTESTGERPRNVYRITDAGRDAFAEWLDRPSSTFTFESEGGVKAFFGDRSDLDTVRSTLREEVAAFREFAEQLSAGRDTWITGNPEFEDRLHYTAMSADLISRVRHAVATWAEDWLERTEHWDGPELDDAKRAEAIEVLERIGSLELPVAPLCD